MPDKVTFRLVEAPAQIVALPLMKPLGEVFTLINALPETAVAAQLASLTAVRM